MAKNVSIILIFTWVLSILQTSVVPSVLNIFAEILGFLLSNISTLDLCLISCLYISFQRPLWISIVFVLVFSLFFEGLGTAWVGIFSLSKLVVVIVASSIRKHLTIPTIPSKMVVAFVFSLLDFIVQYLILLMLYRETYFSLQTFSWGLSHAFFLSLIAPVIFFLYQRFDEVSLPRNWNRESTNVFGQRTDYELGNY